jgi:DNA-binding response OmpR family regulator
MDSQSHILVVDDDNQMRQTIRAILEEENYNIAEACDGNAASRHLHANTVDLVIVDIIMPEKDGIEVIVETKEKFPGTKILSLSGGGLITATDHLSSAQALGANQTLVKPFKNNELVEKVHSLLDG